MRTSDDYGLSIVEDRVFLKSIPALIWVKDAHNNVLAVSDLAATSLGVTATSLEGRRIRDIFPDEADRYFADDLEVMTTGKAKRRIVEPYQLGSGEKIWVRTDKAPRRDSSGAVVGVLAVAFDLTHRANNEIERAKLLRELVLARDTIRKQHGLLSAAAHALRGPMTPLSIKLDLLERLVESDPEIVGMHNERLREVLRSLSRHVDTMAACIDELMSVTRGPNGGVELCRRKEDLSTTVLRATSRHSENAIRAGSPLTMDLESVIGWWDHDQLEKVVMIILANSIRYGQGNPIEVRLTQVGRTALLCVRDQGVGIPPEEQELLFHRFEQASSSRAFDGQALGLFVARNVVEAHGGRIFVRSELGRGAEFFVELPLES